MKSLTTQEIDGIWQKLCPSVFRCHHAADAEYAIPSKKWLLEVARQHAASLEPWRKSFDCDDFAFSLKVEVQKCHAAYTEKIDGLALGVVFYLQHGQGGHAINWAISRGKIYFIEPQNGREICLSELELASAWFVYY
jgi:hypothetical protein